MDSFFDQVKQRKIGFSPMSSKKEDIMSGLEIQSVLENKKFSTCAVELRLRRQYSSHADTCLPLGSKIDPLI